jgi:TrkA domain protein
MPEINEVTLPGVGVRHEFASSSGRRVAVVTHRSGRRELSVYRRDDPDACTEVLQLDDEDAAALSTILGAPKMAPTVQAMQQLEGLALDWLTVDAGSVAAGATIGAGQYRTKTGSSIVAVIRGSDTYPAPEPDFVLEAGDVAVAVGKPEGLATLREQLRA